MPSGFRILEGQDTNSIFHLGGITALKQLIPTILPLLRCGQSVLRWPRRHESGPAEYHLYEAIFESPRMWLKIQASCRSQEQARGYFGSRFGREVPSANPPEYSLSAAFRLSERSECVANWKTMRDNLPDGWDEHEFRLAKGPYSWCEHLTEGCDCHGTEGRLDAFYCSAIGLREDTAQRQSKSLNVRHHAWCRMMGRDDANVETYDEERLQPYRAAVRHMVQSAEALEGEQDPDCLYLVIRVDRKNPRGRGTLTDAQRDFTDPTGGSHRISVSRYGKWDVCLGIVDGLMDSETA